MSSSLLDERHIAVNPSLIKTFGLLKAVLLQEIHYASLEEYVGGEAGQVTMGQAELADRIGLERHQVHRALKELLAARLVRIEQDGPKAVKSYRVNRDAIETACAPARKELHARQRARRGQSDARQRTSNMRASAQDGRSIPLSKEEDFLEEAPPAPEGGADDSGRLFGGNDEPTPAGGFTEESFDELFWPAYPSKGLGSNTRGSRAAALKTWRGIGRRYPKLTPAHVAGRLSHYLRARELATERWGVPAPLKKASAWLNDCHGDWVAAPAGPEDERVEHWAFACKQAAAAGGASADDVDAAFAFATDVWERARHKDGRRADNAREMLTSHDPRIWQAITHCWETLSGSAGLDVKRAAFVQGWAVASKATA